MLNQLKKSKVQEGIFFIIFSAFIIKEALKYNRYGSLALSPSLAPICVAVVMLFLALCLLINGIREDNKRENQNPINKWKDILLLLLTTIIYLILLPIIHFVPSTILYLIVILKLLGENNKKIIIGISLITTFMIYGLFNVLLSVILP